MALPARSIRPGIPCIDAELAVGEHGALCGVLTHLVREHPLRERSPAYLPIRVARRGYADSA
jgi:hypothetical protein